MQTDEEKIGYLIAKVEELAEDQKALAAKVEALNTVVITKLTTAETVFKTLKAVLICAVAVATLKWGDIPALWKAIVG